MKTGGFDLVRQFLSQSRHSLAVYHLARIALCLKMLGEQDVWWRPNPTSNSVGNLVLHLSGNVRQWIISGLGGAPDHRERDREFAESGPVSRRTLLAGLRKTVNEACTVLNALASSQLKRVHSIQGFRVTGFEAIFHVTEHFAYHTGQIIFITKLMRGEDLAFTRLPGGRRKAAIKTKLSQV